MSLNIQLITVSILILQRQLSHNQLNKRNSWYDTYDYIVVGAGSAGAVVANRLTENPNINVLLLEAGGPQTLTTDIPVTWIGLLGSDIDWGYQTVPQKNYAMANNGRVPLSRGRVIGGSSSINAMIYNRGNRRSYDDWANTYGAKGWSFDEVLPYFMKSENNSDMRVVSKNPGYHGTNGPVGISSDLNPQPIFQLYLKAMNELGFETIDVNGPKQVGTTIIQNFIDSNTGLRSSTGNAYIDPNPHPNNLHILTNAFVTKILFNDNPYNLRATGVQFDKNSKTYQIMAKKEVIISGGTINSPQLLMLSGIGPKDHLNQFGIPLKADLPVGDHLQDHPYVGPITPIIRNNVPINPMPELSITQLDQLLTNRSGPLSRFTAHFTYHNTKSNPTKDWPNIFVGTGMTNVNESLIAYLWQKYPDLKQTMNRRYLSGQWLTVFAFLYRVRSYGTIRLASSNPYVYPLIDPRYLAETQDHDDMLEALRFIFYYLTQSSMANYVYVIPEPIQGCSDSVCPNGLYYECDSYLRCLIRQLGASVWHPVGTCRMGSADRNDVVVDQTLRVKGVGALRVCDASVMPQIPNANTNAATIMIGEKCADLIKQQI